MVKEVEIDDVSIPFTKLERQAAMPFLPTTLSDFLKIALALLPIAIVVWAIRRDQKLAAVHNAPLSPNELRNLIAAIPDEALRSRIANAVRTSAAERPVTRKIFDRIVLDARNERVAADQLAALPTATA